MRIAIPVMAVRAALAGPRAIAVTRRTRSMTISIPARVVAIAPTFRSRPLAGGRRSCHFNLAFDAAKKETP
jgi:hypothetical protein